MARFGAATRLFTEEYEASFAFRAARLHRIRGVQIAHEPGSRADFAQAIQLLGASPKVRRLMTSGLPIPVHVSSSRGDWEEVFGEIECIEEGRVTEVVNCLSQSDFVRRKAA